MTLFENQEEVNSGYYNNNKNNKKSYRDCLSK